MLPSPKNPLAFPSCASRRSNPLVLVLLCALALSCSKNEAPGTENTEQKEAPTKVYDKDPSCSEGKPLPFGCMQKIRGGTFLRGAQSSDPGEPGYDPLASEDEGPPREIKISDFEMHLFEVVVWQYENCVEAGACKLKDVAREGYFYNFRWPKPAHRHKDPQKNSPMEQALVKAEEVLKPEGKTSAIPNDMKTRIREKKNQPVNGVNWFGARDYCAWIDARLPTEAEWEFAARGPNSHRFPWGDIMPDEKLAVFGPGRREAGTSEAPQTPGAGPFSHEHLAGNVWEWVADTYDAKHYTSASNQNPQGPDKGESKVIRGGSWADQDGADLRAAYRASMPPDTKSHDIGFRCVRSIKR